MVAMSSSTNSSSSGVSAEDVGGTSDIILYYITTFNFCVICELGATVGTVTNVINIVVFLKMGFADQVNISLLALAVSDLCSLLSLHWLALCFNPLFVALDFSFDPYDLQYLSAGFPHVLFTRITASITAFITLERCLCVYIPLKVKVVLTPRRVKCVICSLFIVSLLCAAPFYYSNRLGPKFFQERNRTLLGLVFTKNRVLIDIILFATMHVSVTFGTVIIVTVCTFVIVAKMKEKAKWRAQASTADNTQQVSVRDQKVTRMVVTIATLFLICFIPMALCLIPMVVFPEFSIQGKYKAEFVAFCSFNFILESLNSSANIAIYLKMSRRYREVFNAIFFKRKPGENSK